MTRAMVDQEKRITIRIPESLHRKIKAKAALLGKTVTDILKEYLEAWIEEAPPELGQKGELEDEE